MQRDEHAIIQRTLAGDVDAFRQLVEAHQTRLYRFVCNLVADRHTAEEIAQDCFLKAYQKLETFKPERASFGTWLLRIARNHCLNTLKKRRPDSLANPEIVTHNESLEKLEQLEWRTQLDSALEQLPPQQKTAFVLAEIEELSLQQIADIEEVPIGTVKSRISRAKKALRESIALDVPE